jgi:hypothetical protein
MQRERLLASVRGIRASLTCLRELNGEHKIRRAAIQALIRETYVLENDLLEMEMDPGERFCDNPTCRVALPALLPGTYCSSQCAEEDSGKEELRHAG